MSSTKKSLSIIIGLILATTAALAAMGAMGNGLPSIKPLDAASDDGPLALTGEVVQDKVLMGGDGRVTVSLNLTGARLPETGDAPQQAVDLAIVLDRSGSMQGGKLSDARQAIEHLVDRLGPDDRLALLTYSNDVETRSSLLPMDDANRRRIIDAMRAVRAGGGTNLGAGLSRGIDMLVQTTGNHRQRKIILISDGLANQGVTGPDALGRLASAAVQNRFAISTVGVGLEFNELVMTAIADQGAGHYYFLENPRVFANVFESELTAGRQVAAADVAVHVSAVPGVRLVDVGGYPIDYKNGAAVIHPGNLLSGQNRSLYLTFQVPTNKERDISLGRIQVQYRDGEMARTGEISHPLSIACVTDPAAVVASINKTQWADQVIHDEFSRLKEEVAADIRSDQKEKAQERITAYEQRQASINAVVGSGKVAENLDTDVRRLRQRVEETFVGAPAAVAEKKKQAAKSLQYEGYKARRAK